VLRLFAGLAKGAEVGGGIYRQRNPARLFQAPAGLPLAQQRRLGGGRTGWLGCIFHQG
jgi:hypothetical protein